MDEKPFISPSITPGPPVSAKSSSRLIIKIVVGIVIAAIVVIGILLFTTDLVLFKVSPEKAIEKMLANMEKVKTSRSEMKININLADENLNEETEIFLNFNVDRDITDLEDPKAAMDFDVVATMPGYDYNPSVEKNLTEQLQIRGKSITIGRTGYFRLDDINLSGLEFLLLMSGINKSDLEKQWIKIEEKDLESFGAAPNPQLLEEQLILIDKISGLLKEKKVYYVKKELPGEKINGKKAYHYLLGINQQNITEIIKEIFRTGLEAYDEAFLEESEFIIETSIKEFLEKIGELNIEIWIGKKDFLLYRIKTEKEIALSQFKEDSEGKININFDWKFSNFNKLIKIEAPTEFKLLEDILGGLSGLGDFISFYR